MASIAAVIGHTTVANVRTRFGGINLTVRIGAIFVGSTIFHVTFVTRKRLIVAFVQSIWNLTSLFTFLFGNTGCSVGQLLAPTPMHLAVKSLIKKQIVPKVAPLHPNCTNAMLCPEPARPAPNRTVLQTPTAPVRTVISKVPDPGRATVRPVPKKINVPQIVD